MREQKCYSCKAFSECLSNAIDNGIEECQDFEKLKIQVDDAIGKLDSLGLPYPFSKEEIKSLLFFANAK